MRVIIVLALVFLLFTSCGSKAGMDDRAADTASLKETEQNKKPILKT